MPHTTYKDWPSVTECLNVLNKPFLAIWRGKLGNQEAERIMKESQVVGTKLHDYVERFLTKGEIPVDEPRFGAWYDWWITAQYETKEVEVKVISKKHRFHGSFDAILAKDGLVLTDWKFSNSDDHFRYLQLAGYAQAYFEQTGIKIEKGLVVRVDKEAKVHVKEVTNLQKYIPYFIYCRKLFDFVNHKGKFKK